MRKFLLKCILLAVILFVPVAVVETIDLVLRTRTSFELPKDKTILFIGDSHIETSVNEKFIPGAFNNAKSADFYLNEFSRTKKFLDANPQIRTVFITATPLSLRGNANRRGVGGDAKVLLQLSMPFYGREELENSWKTAMKMFMDVRSFERALGRIVGGKSAKIEELGGFIDHGDENDGLLKEIRDGGKLGKKRLGPYPTGYSNTLTVKYLRKIVELVRARGGRIIFLNPPIYHEEEFLDVPYFENLLKEKFPDVEVWDYGNYPMPEDCFKDINHLNGKGAGIFSKELARRMREEEIIGD